MTSTWHDPHDLPDLLTYLTEPIVGAKHGGGNHGGTAERNDGVTHELPRAQANLAHKVARPMVEGGAPATVTGAAGMLR